MQSVCDPCHCNNVPKTFLLENCPACQSQILLGYWSSAPDQRLDFGPCSLCVFSNFLTMFTNGSTIGNGGTCLPSMSRKRYSRASSPTWNAFPVFQAASPPAC